MNIEYRATAIVVIIIVALQVHRLVSESSTVYVVGNTRIESVGCILKVEGNGGIIKIRSGSSEESVPYTKSEDILLTHGIGKYTIVVYERANYRHKIVEDEMREVGSVGIKCNKEPTFLEGTYLSNLRVGGRSVKEGEIENFIYEVSHNMSGMCVDKASYVSSVLRKSKIPSKVVFGLNNNGQEHAWVSFLKGKEWVSIDVTKNVIVGKGYKALEIY